MTALRAWLAAPLLGISRWRWAGALLGCVLVALLWRPALAWLSLLPLLGAPRRHPGRIDWQAADATARARNVHLAADAAERGARVEAAGEADRERVAGLSPDDLARELEETRDTTARDRARVERRARDRAQENAAAADEERRDARGRLPERHRWKP